MVIGWGLRWVPNEKQFPPPPMSINSAPSVSSSSEQKECSIRGQGTDDWKIKKEINHNRNIEVDKKNYAFLYYCNLQVHSLFIFIWLGNKCMIHTSNVPCWNKFMGIHNPFCNKPFMVDTWYSSWAEWLTVSSWTSTETPLIKFIIATPGTPSAWSQTPPTTTNFPFMTWAEWEYLKNECMD